MYLALWLIRRWRLPATPAFTLPDAVSLKRFLAPDLVFSFGISRRSARLRPSGRVAGPPWHAFGQAAPKRGGSYAKGGCESRLWEGGAAALRPGEHAHAGQRREDRAGDHAQPHLGLG